MFRFRYWVNGGIPAKALAKTSTQHRNSPRGPFRLAPLAWYPVKSVDGPIPSSTHLAAGWSSSPLVHPHGTRDCKPVRSATLAHRAADPCGLPRNPDSTGGVAFPAFHHFSPEPVGISEAREPRCAPVA